MKNKLKKIFSTFYDKDFDFIEKTENGTYIFCPHLNSKGYEVNSLEELKPILILWRISEIANVTNILLFLIVLMLILHQSIKIDVIYHCSILTYLLVIMIAGILAKLGLKRYKQISAKTKINKKTIIAIFLFIGLISGIFGFFMGINPSIIYCSSCKNGEWQKQINTINKLLKINKNPKFYIHRAYAKFNLKDFDGALEDINKAIEIKGANSELMSIKGYILFNKEEKITPEIEKLFETSIKSEDLTITHAFRGEIYAITGEYDKGIKDFEQAYILSHDEYFNYLTGLVYEQKGDFCKANAYYSTIPPNEAFSFDLEFKQNYTRIKCKNK